MTEYTTEVTELKKTNKPNQYIPGTSRGKNKETYIIWEGFEGSISTWAVNLNYSVSRLRNKINTMGLCAESMEPNKNQGPGSRSGAAKNHQALFERRCERILSILKENPEGVSTSYLQSLMKIRISHINQYLRKMEEKGEVSVKSIASKNIWFSTARPVDKAYKQFCFKSTDKLEVQPIEFDIPKVQKWVYEPPVKSLIPINNQ